MFVHIPIGLLFAYAVLELSSCVVPFVRRQEWVPKTKIFLVIAGVLSMLPALGTGDLASETLKNGSEAKDIVEIHETFASLTFIIFGFIALSYLTREIIKSTVRFPKILLRVARFVQPFTDRVITTSIVALLSLVGLVTLTILGGLGGAMVYGHEVDPIVAFIYSLFR